MGVGEGSERRLSIFARFIFRQTSKGGQDVSGLDRPLSNILLEKPCLGVETLKSEAFLCQSEYEKLNDEDVSQRRESADADEYRQKQETDKLLDKEGDKLDCETSRLRMWVLVISWLSLVSLGSLGVVTLVIGIMYNSPSSFAFSLDALLDCASSLVIIWRFYSVSAMYDHRKEKIACISLGVLFILSGFSVVIRSSEAIRRDIRPSQDDVIWLMAVINGMVCIVLFIGYVYLAKKLRSISLLTDSMIAAIGLFLALATLTSDKVYEHHDNIWYLDPLLGLVCSAFLFAYGVVIIIYELKCHKPEESSDDKKDDCESQKKSSKTNGIK